MAEEHKKGVNKLLAKSFSYVAGTLGLLQGIAWFVFSILSILCYFGSIQVEEPSTKTEYYKIIYFIFLDKDNSIDQVIVTPANCHIFLWFYVVFSFIWTCVSGSIIWAMIHEQWQLTKSLFGAWSGITILTSIVDIVFTALIAADYVTVEKKAATTETLVAYGIVMSIAARGYILWIINVIIAGFMTKFTIDIILNDNSETTLPIIHGYESSEVNPPWFDGSVKDFWGSPQNKDNEDGYDNHGFRRSQSFYPMDMTNENIYTPPPADMYTKPIDNPIYKNTTPNGFSSPPNKTYKTPSNNKNYSNTTPNNNQPTTFSEAIAQKTATIGRNKGRRSPLNHVSPPVIPDPDYSPPNSPHGLKSVLRSKSNYNKAVY